MHPLKIVSLRLLSAAGVAFIAACALEGTARQPDATAGTLFEGARLIVGNGSAPIEDSAFLVDGTRFTSVGRRGEIEAPAAAVRVDLTGRTVMPALVDLHSHLGYSDEVLDTERKENYTPENLLDHLDRYAYTGHALTMSLGSDPPAEFVWRTRTESIEGSFTGARFETVGRGLAWPGTGPNVIARNDTPYPITSKWQARLAIRELAARGVPFAKIWVEDRRGFTVPPQNASRRDELTREHGIPDVGEPARLTPAIAEAAVDEAQQLGLRTIAHVKTVDELEFLLRAGIDAWTHPIADRPPDDELMGLIRERPRLWYAPVITPAPRGGSAPRAAGERPEWLEDPLLRAIKCPGFLEEWGQSFESGTTAPGPTGGLGVENVKKFYDAGVRIALGSHDAGGNRVVAWNSHMELEAFVNWVGMTPHEAIVAATSFPAEILGLDLGMVAVGRGADFLVLDANPLDDIANTRRISEVYLRGRQVDRAAMAARWQAACRAASTSGPG
jgi:imidazolonepropionase-like amidohydrolase